MYNLDVAFILDFCKILIVHCKRMLKSMLIPYRWHLFDRSMNGHSANLLPFQIPMSYRRL